MPLPSGHQWENTPPTVSNSYLPYLVIGSSNHAVGAQTTTAEVHYNTSRNFIYKHNDTIAGYADPPNNQSVSTYSRLDESGTQNYTSFLSEMLREHTDKKVCAITAGQSATGISNQITGYNSPTTLTQTTNLLNAAKAKTGALKFACVGVSDGDMIFNQDAPTVTSLITSYIANLRTAAGNPNLPIMLICSGLVPPSHTATYPSWTTNNDAMEIIDISGVYPIITDDMAVATYRESDEVHRNAAGNLEVADRIRDKLVLEGII